MGRRMITIDARWIYTSGIGTYLRHIIPGIVKHFSGHLFTILGDKYELNKLLGPDSKNCTFVHANAGMYSIREQIDFIRLIPRDTDLYFATHYNVPLFYRGVMLVTVYDLFHLAMPELVGGIHKTLYARLMFSAVRRKSSAIITISEFTKSELIRFTGPVGNQSITPIHLGIDEEWFSIPRGNSPHNRPYILYVGNIKPHKNLGSLIKAFEIISDRVPHDLILVGKKEGFITGDTLAAISAQCCNGRVRFTGHVDHMQLKRYITNASALVFPSLYEGFGLPPLEAMAALCPVLVSNVGPMPEICGDAALYCDPYRVEDIAEKMMMLLSDDSLRYSLRELGLEHAKKFNWERCINETCNVIEKLLT